MLYPLLYPTKPPWSCLNSAFVISENDNDIPSKKDNLAPALSW